ncbi:metallophosphoesterase [Oceanobacillus alkalisoli]|uniref:metallophosphoesterase n=1 Tax=Oceanobacillus alkalisoli TaxID=2925113 RepID=UPI001EF0386B|nr:metallophosphoesterase [Oceanobacillus alkalisoli]MCF3943406.1 metallophosphoesterase [Oceanobacillus alkalisoli]MCG5103995.1 metallophosphoesterase [Oceanobacillus alkalisoli]
MLKYVWRFFTIFAMWLTLKTWKDTNHVKINRIEFKTNKLRPSQSLRIIQLSDMHNKRAWNIHQRLLHKINRSSPDIIVITGDLIDRRTRNFKQIFNFLDQLINMHIPIYFVTGNHEWGNRKRKKFMKQLRKRNITILGNESTRIQVAGIPLTLVGVHDSSTHHENVEEAFQQISETGYTILLSHSPYVIKTYPNLPADLVLSGHTHGGQVRLPFIGAVISPGGGVFPELDKGTCEWKRNRYIYVDSGLGTSMIPVRFLNQSQISLIEINGDN